MTDDVIEPNTTTEETAPEGPKEQALETAPNDEKIGTVEPDHEQSISDPVETDEKEPVKKIDAIDKKQVNTVDIQDADERFTLPRGHQDRFLLVKEANRQDLYRSAQDKLPTITDYGDSLSTRKADRATAIDMVELAAHRGWNSMRVRGPEEFRREMWIEGTALGLSIQGYKPRDVDLVEAKTRSEIVGVRSIENTSKEVVQHQQGKTHSPTDNTRADKAPEPLEIPSYEKGVMGKIIETGEAPYQNREKAAYSPFVAVELADGREHKIWGVRLPDMLKDYDLKVGDTARIQWNGYKDVTLTVKDQKTGKDKEITSQRREWAAHDIERAKIKEVSKPKETATQSKEPVASQNSAFKPDYEKGVSGKIIDTGSTLTAAKTNMPYITLELADGREHKIRGLRLPDMIFAHDLKIGDKANIKWNDYKNVIITSKDEKTGEPKEFVGTQRDWAATEIQRVKDQPTPEQQVTPSKQEQQPANKTEQKELEQIAARILSPEAVKDPKLIGAKSIVSKVDIELRALSQSDEKREKSRQDLALELAKGVRKGKVYDVQTLPNVTKEQQKKSKDIAERLYKAAQQDKTQDRTKEAQDKAIER